MTTPAESDRSVELIGPFESVSRVSDALRARGARICSFDDGRRTRLMLDEASAGAIRVGEVLDRFVQHEPDYTWDAPRPDLLNLFPRSSPLDAPVPAVTAQETGVWRLVDDALRQAGGTIRRLDGFGTAEGPELTLSLPEASLRDVLNQVVSAFDRLVWHISGSPDAYFLSFTEVPSPPGTSER